MHRTLESIVRCPELTSNYFNAFEIVMLSVGIVAVILWIISMWRRGGQYTGKMHRLLAVAGIAAGIMGYMGLYQCSDRESGDLQLFW